jgi:putative heme-binding domain-containing protein
LFLMMFDQLPDDHLCPIKAFIFMRSGHPVFCAIVMCGNVAGVPARASALDCAVPSPVAVWPAGPLDLVVAFPGPVDPQWTRSFIGKSISYFNSVGADGRQASAAAPLGSLRIAGAKLVDEGRTLLLATDPHPRAARYELFFGPSRDAGRTIVYDLSGVEAAWTAGKEDAGADPAWKGWWPDLDADATRRLTRGSAPHERVLALIKEPGRLTLSTLVSLPPGAAAVRIEASAAILDATLGDEQPAADSEPAGDETRRVVMTASPSGEPLFLSVTVETGKNGRPPMIRASYAQGKSEPVQPIERQRFMVPWAPVPPAALSIPVVSVPDLAGGVPKRGELLFFSDQARCSQCHAFGGRGGTIGPNLTDVGRKGKDQIYRSIAAPSVEISPDYVPYTIAARDGRVLAGVVRAEGADAIRVTDTGAKTTTLRRDEIDQIRPSGTSIMPVGLSGGLGEAGLRDLIAYLTSGR